MKCLPSEVLFFLERCLPLRASDVAFVSDVHCVSDVTPDGVVANITSLRSNIIMREHNITSAKPILHCINPHPIVILRKM